MTAATYASTALQRVEDALHRQGCRPRSVPSGLQARCPAHEDSSPSLSVGLRDDGQGAVVRCHAGCTAQSIVEALELTLADLFDQPRTGGDPLPAVCAEVRYPYVDEHGQLLFEVVRKPGKQFRQRVPDGAGGWVWKLGDTRRVLYHLPEVLEAVAAGRTVHVVEGEKDTDRLRSLGLVATCNPGGAGKWRSDYAQHLAGATVVVIADRDEPGRRHAEDVRASLTGTAGTITVLEPAQGKDVSDHLDSGLTLDQLPPTGTAAPEPAASRYTPVDWHELFSRDRTTAVEWLCEPLIEVGRVTALYSKAKAGKSLLTLDIVAALAAGRSALGQAPRPRISVLYVDLENSEDDIWERLRDLGYGPDDLAGLHYYSFPDLPALDNAQGGAALLKLAQLHDAQVIVIDTTSRVIDGEEDSADTFRSLYRHAIMPLKRERRAVLRLDHSGKDATAGQRGSSAKNDAEDYVWFLTATPAGRIDLRRTHSRTNHGDEQLSLRRLTEPKLRHVPTRDGIAPDVQRVLDLLDELGLPMDAGRDRAKKALIEAGHKIGNDVLAATIRTRKELLHQAETCPENLSADLEQQSLAGIGDDLSEPADESAGQTCPGQVADRSDRCPAVPADDLSGVLPLLEGGQDGQRTQPDTTCVCRFDLPNGQHFDYCHHATKTP
jgi:hypothetical protein